ncbi:unnamed protein product [Didymodactylos carnosus]|uniref:TLDc domain-containing protein n=1 Tax=Didymodactylos carnosus TaxID=1234261 RepID=A0A813Y0Q4_9BILA|nr:unnamed protein product [Didymodactylos carnosus]CAF0875006.1 unnamed protein product [Didymodactylos carnosus]CAF3610346.1 unnamed protein product [Didymodactylos carnosus]CAF3661939.1 unnamed protein product [Didymodactylos carnosus]
MYDHEVQQIIVDLELHTNRINELQRLLADEMRLYSTKMNEFQQKITTMHNIKPDEHDQQKKQNTEESKEDKPEANVVVIYKKRSPSVHSVEDFPPNFLPHQQKKQNTEDSDSDKLEVKESDVIHKKRSSSVHSVEDYNSNKSTEISKSASNQISWKQVEMKSDEILTEVHDDEQLFFNGSLLTLEHQFLLNKFCGKPKQKWQLIYKATRDDFSSASFHRLCDSQCPTITVIQATNGSLFGGYANVPWSSTDQYVKDSSAFLFTLTNPHHISPTKYYNYQFPQFAVRHHIEFGPTFGGGSDIKIESDSNKNDNSYINFPHSYTDTTRKGRVTFTGSKNFTTNDIEVYVQLT